jgi:hypothetical protein
MASKNISQKNTSTELKLLNEWQNRLGLQDWFIILETNCEPEKMDLQGADGCVSYTETTKAAKIQIIDEKHRTGGIRPFNFEETLVHELLHMKLCLLERGEDWDNKLQLRLLHTIIDDIARALVDAKNTAKEIEQKEE